MTNKLRNLYVLFFTFFFSFNQLAYAQKETNILNRADVLFEQQEYAESFLLYKQILESQQKSSPQMILKMAYTQEIAKNYTAALYYLHLYYDKIPQRAVLEKIEAMALKRNYAGYSFNDLEFFQTQLNKLYLDILEVMLMIAVLVVTITILNKRKKKITTPTFQLAFMAYLLFIVYYINFLSFVKKGIIRQSNVAIMSAPAAGSTWLATATEGHKIDLKGERDIWYETEWNGQRAFIRKSNVLELP